MSGLRQIGLIAAFAGIALAALGHEGATSSAQTTAGGAVWLLVSALAIAFYYVWSVELTTTVYGTATVAAWSTLIGFIALIPWTARELWSVSSFHLTA